MPIEMEGQIIWVDCADDNWTLDKDWIWEIRAKHQDLFAKVDSDDSDNNSDDSNDSDESDDNDDE